MDDMLTFKMTGNRYGGCQTQSMGHPFEQHIWNGMAEATQQSAVGGHLGRRQYMVDGTRHVTNHFYYHYDDVLPIRFCWLTEP